MRRPLVAAVALVLLAPLGAGTARAQEVDPRRAPEGPSPGGQTGAGAEGAHEPSDQPPGFPSRPEAPGAHQEPGALDLRDLESWIVLEEEEAPEPPLLRVSFGGVAWIQARSQLRSDRFGRRGTDLDDLEEEQGLESSGVSPWAEATIGARVRGGFDYLELFRRGDLQRQTEDVVFEGVTVARAGERCSAELSFLTTSARIEWDGLYGRTYRLGILGGVRYFHISAALAGQGLGTAPSTVRRSAELVSPFFGGRVELTPFEFLSVSSRVEFMNWSWHAVGLKEARYLDLRIGATVHIIPGTLGLGLEYRFLYVRARADEDESTGDEEFEGGLSAAGAAFTLSLSF